MTYFSTDEFEERLEHETVEECLEAHFNDLCPGPLKEAAFIVEVLVPNTPVKVFRFDRAVINPQHQARTADMLLELLTERFEDEYGNPDEPAETTEAVRQLLKLATDLHYKESRVWKCEKTGVAVTYGAEAVIQMLGLEDAPSLESFGVHQFKRFGTDGGRATKPTTPAKPSNPKPPKSDHRF